MSAWGGINLRLGVAAGLSLMLLPLLAPWPLLQAPVHAALVLGIAPGFHSRLAGILWASAAGWAVELSLRLVPQTGIWPLVDMTMALALSWTLEHWPPEGRLARWGRLGIAAILHMVLIHGLQRWLIGPHVWGWDGWVVVATVPLWGSWPVRWYRPFPRR